MKATIDLIEPKMSIKKPIYSDKNLFAIEICGLPGQLDSYFEACDTLKHQTNLFMQNAASNTPPGEVVDMEDLKSANKELYKQAVGQFQ